MPERALREDSSPLHVELPHSVQVFETSADVTFAAESGVMLQVWRGRPTVAAFDRLDGYYRELQKLHPRYAGLVLMEPGHIAPPDAAARQRAADLIKVREHEMAGLGFVIEGTSFKYNVLRFSLTTIALLSGSSLQQPVFATVADASAWLAGVLGGVSPAQLERVVTQLRVLRTTRNNE